MASQGLTGKDADAMLDKIVSFEDGSRYERLEPMTNFRKDDGVARILYLCRRVPVRGEVGSLGVQNGLVDDGAESEKFVMKIKFQVTNTTSPTPLPGPPPSTAAELHALITFGQHLRPNVPHLVAFKTSTQGPGPESLCPGGYVAITVMTRMPGVTLLELGFWSEDEQVRGRIREAFLRVLRDIWRDGFMPYDRALRNILWEKETQRCSIVDFEHYHPGKDPINMNETEEMQLWGLVRRPAPVSWHQEWGISGAGS